MQGGQGDVKHWAFNDPLPRKGRYKDAPPPSAEYRKLATRVVDLHPLTIAQNARTSGGGNISLVPTKAITRRPGRNLEGGEGFDLARRPARQPLRPASHRLDDLEAHRRHVSADVAARRASERAVQLLSRGDWNVRGRDALRHGV